MIDYKRERNVWFGLYVVMLIMLTISAIIFTVQKTNLQRELEAERKKNHTEAVIEAMQGWENAVSIATDCFITLEVCRKTCGGKP